MSDKKFLNDRHRKRSEQAIVLRKSFATAYAYLLRSRLRVGKDIRGIQVLAAKAAGVGQQRDGSKGSWSDHAAYQTQRSVSTRMMKDAVVIGELKRLGLAFDDVKGVWYDPEI